MSSTTSSTISPLTVESDASLQAIYNSTTYTIGQSAVGIIINLLIVIWLKMAFEPKLIYRLLMVDSATNLVGLFGFCIMWIITQYPETPKPLHEVMCTLSAALCTIWLFNFYLSNLLIACPR